MTPIYTLYTPTPFHHASVCVLPEPCTGLLIYLLIFAHLEPLNTNM